MPEVLDAAKAFMSKQSVDSWELFFTVSRSFRVEVKESIVDSLQRSSLKGLSVRIIKDGKSGFSFCSSSDPYDVEKTIENAVEMASVMPTDDSASFTSGNMVYTRNHGLFDEMLVAIPEKDKINIARTIEKEAYASDKRISIARSSGYIDSVTESRLMNSEGLDVADRCGICSAWVELMAEESGEQETSYWYDQNRNPERLAPADIARTAAMRAIKALGGKTVASGKMPVIFENDTAAGILGVISNSFVAENHFKKTASPRVVKGEKLFSENLRIIDDGTEERGELAFGFDGEGVPTQKTVVVDGGVVSSWLYDRYYGMKFSHPSTGNSRRAGFETPPSSGITNFYVEPGELSVEEMIAGMTKGILVTEVMGLHTANPVSGNFSVGASGFAISGGAISHPVKGIAIAGNLLELFAHIIEIGNDFRFFGNVGSSSLLCETISVSGS